MRPRLPIRRILLLRPFRPPSRTRLFTQHTSRPQLPFLSPKQTRVSRFLTTETRQWIKSEVKLAGKYTLALYTGTFLVLVMACGVVVETLERRYPSPPEWSWTSRVLWTNARYNEEEQAVIDWLRTWKAYVGVLKRLEDPAIDGAGLIEQEEGGILVAGIGKTGFDISSKSEPWRRGYYEVLMGAARGAEYLESYVSDRTRNIVFPRSVVIGPSNPKPRPVPPGAYPAPKEEDCEPFSDPPESFYMRILTTHGFSEKQRVDAALAYATWLDVKGTPETAVEMYRWALDIAGSKKSLDSGTGILNTNAGPPSTNVLTATTSLAIHHARNSNLNLALPIFISILRARRLLPDAPIPPPAVQAESPGLVKALVAMARSALISPEYPPPPIDGTSPPLRDSKERCEEAAIMTYIGEILYASNASKSSREDGLAWTREAVDIAEGEMRKVALNKAGKETCKQCLEVGLHNWVTMVKKMAQEEKEVPVAKVGGWLGFRGELPKDTVGRWESEEQVIKERLRRVRDIIDELPEVAGPGLTWLDDQSLYYLFKYPISRGYVPVLLEV